MMAANFRSKKESRKSDPTRHSIHPGSMHRLFFCSSLFPVETGEPEADGGASVLQALPDLLASLQPLRRLLLPHRAPHEAPRDPQPRLGLLRPRPGRHEQPRGRRAHPLGRGLLARHSQDHQGTREDPRNIRSRRGQTLLKGGRNKAFWKDLVQFKKPWFNLRQFLQALFYFQKPLFNISIP